MISVFYTYYGQKELIPVIQSKGVPCTIIDDGSPEPLGKVDGCDVYRIEEDIPWNIPGAKNLGFHVLDGWILHLPIDHIIDKETYDKLDKMEKKEDEVYFLGSVHNGEVEPPEQSPHDMVLIHKSAYEKIGGYDEDFAGAYGYEDGLFWQMCKNNFKAIDRFDILIEWYPQGYTQNYNRDSSRNLKIYNSKNKDKMLTPKLRFQWKKL